jgi:hypothetical protein
LVNRAASIAKCLRSRANVKDPSSLRLYVLIPRPDQPLESALELVVMNDWLLLMNRRASSERALI